MRVQYFHRETIDSKERELKELFDLNFGKDWRLFIILYYSPEYGKHAFHYKNPTEVEAERFKNRNFANKVRAGYYACCAEIMKVYLSQGKEEAEKLINEDKFRFRWYFKAGAEKQTIISDELYNKLHGITEVSKKQEVKPKQNQEQKELVSELEEVNSKISSLEEQLLSLDNELEKETDKNKEQDLWEEYKSIRRELNMLRNKNNQLNFQLEQLAMDQNSKLKKS